MEKWKYYYMYTNVDSGIYVLNLSENRKSHRTTLGFHPPSSMAMLFVWILIFTIIFSSSYAFTYNINKQISYHFKFPRYTSSSLYVDLNEYYSIGIDSNDDEYDDDAEAQSQFGTRSYWDEMYAGVGEFPMDEYSWYYSWGDVIQPIWSAQVLPRLSRKKESYILIPGIGNDPIILDLFQSGYNQITAFDYSSNAVDRQNDLLGNFAPKALESVDLLTLDATRLIQQVKEQHQQDWDSKFDVILEKGALDAIYLSDEEGLKVSKAVEELTQTLTKGGIFVSCSGESFYYHDSFIYIYFFFILHKRLTIYFVMAL